MLMEHYFENRLALRQTAGNRRQLPYVRKGIIDFASNDYLGLARNQLLKERVIDAWKQLSPPFMGATGSRLLTGNSMLAEEVESCVAAFHEAPAGLLFNCGYLANSGLIAALATSQDVCLADSHIHASMQQGIRLSGAKSFSWRHNDVAHLETRLKQLSQANRCFILIESVYSCDGSQAPLLDIVALCQQYGAYLIVDEAHATGVVGPQGRGLVVQEGCQTKVLARIHTFSKALGCQGAIVLGSKRLKEYLINFCHAFVYTTALSPFLLVAIQEAYKLLEEAQKERASLNFLIQHFLNITSQTHLPCLPSQHPIQSILIPGNEKCELAACQLRRQGLEVAALKSPTVRRGKECLRIGLHAFNAKEEIDLLVNQLQL